MTITPIAFNNLITAAVVGPPAVAAVYADIASDADLRALHPDMDNNRWKDEDNFRATLRASFDQLILDLAGAGWESSLISNSDANRAWLKSPVVFGALVIAFRDFKAEPTDRWAMLQDEYQAKYDSLVKTARLDYDSDESGDVSTSETAIEKGVVLLR